MPATVAQDVTAIRRGIDEASRRFEDLFNQGDAAAAARGLYTRDARVLPPGAEMVQGRTRSRNSGRRPRPRRRLVSGGCS